MYANMQKAEQLGQKQLVLKIHTSIEFIKKIAYMLVAKVLNKTLSTILVRNSLYINYFRHLTKNILLSKDLQFMPQYNNKG